MDNSPSVISPADYHETEDQGIFAVSRELKEKLHAHFVTSLRKYSEEYGWVMHIVPDGTPDAGFPEVCVIPAGQDNGKTLHSFRIDAGIPDVLNSEDAKRPDVDRIIRIALLTQRRVAGALDTHLPAILSSYAIGTFISHGEGSYDPDKWAKVGFEFVKELWAKKDSTELLKEMFS